MTSVKTADITTTLRKIIVKALRLDKAPEEIKGDNLISELGITSIDSLEILINVEIAYDILIPDEDLNQNLVSSLAALAGYVEARI